MKDKRPDIFHKFFRLFTIVHPGETLTVLLLALNIFLIGGAYSILKPVRKGLILTKHSAEQEAYLFAVVAILLIFVIKLFSFLSSKIPRQKLIASVTLFFISNLVLFYILSEAGMSLSILGIIFWIWVSIFNVFIIAQFWAFSNDLYSVEAGKRLFPIIMFGQNMGFYLGAKGTSLLVKPQGPFSPFQLMIVASIVEKQRDVPVVRDVDVLVVGGGTAGVPAALAAARLGVRTMLVEKFNSLGGAITQGLTITLPQPIVSPILAEIIGRLREKYDAVGRKSRIDFPSCQASCFAVEFDTLCGRGRPTGAPPFCMRQMPHHAPSMGRKRKPMF